MYSWGWLQYSTVCFLCPRRSSHAKPSPSGNRKSGLQLFCISRVVCYIVQVALFLLQSSLSFPLLWFFLPTELFQSPHLLLKVLMLIPRWGRKEKSLLCCLEYIDVKGSLNCMIMKKRQNFLIVKSTLKLTATYLVLLLAVILDWTWKISSGTFRTNKVALFSNKWWVRIYYFHCIYWSTVFKWAAEYKNQQETRMKISPFSSSSAV